MKLLLALLFLVPLEASAAYDANGVPLGAPEKAIIGKFPSAYCRPLQWSSDAADRRCDDAKVVVGGVPGRITFYLKQDKVQAFDLRFESRDAERLVNFLKQRYGAPADETRETIEGKAGGALYKVQWHKGEEQAVLTAQAEKRRGGSIIVWRGNFEEEIYRIR
jgi:hypothetical protein